jgi:hypothetical protein
MASATAIEAVVEIPPVQTASSDKLPPLAHELIFLADGSLNLWQGASGQIERLAGPSAPDDPTGTVYRYSISADQHWLALLRAGPGARPTEPVSGEFVISTLDLTNHIETVLFTSAADAEGVQQFALSPDGKWVAFIPAPLLRAGAGDVHGYSVGVYVLPTDGSAPPREIGQCAMIETSESDGPCDYNTHLLWAPSSQALAWEDGRGLWRSDLTTPAQLLIADSLSPTEAADVYIYILQAWSPDERFLLAWEQYYEGASQVIVDTQTGQRIPLPNSREGAPATRRLGWLPDGRLLAIRRDGLFDEPTFTLAGEVWRLDATTGALVLDQSFLIAADARGAPAVSGVTALPNGDMAWAILSQSNVDAQTRGIYRYTPATGEMVKLNGLPPTTAGYEVAVWDITGPRVAWAPDGAAIVDVPAYGLIFYAPADGKAVYDVSGALGDIPVGFTWLN